MGNRDGTLAGRHADGHAYVILGVEPGNMVGVPHWDSADIENWLSPFVGPDLRYDAHYVGKDGKEALVLVVDPPRQGDPIYRLRKASQDVGGNAMRDGTIYVRHGSKTEPAMSADIDRLTARAITAEETKLDLAVELDASQVSVISPDLLTDAYRDGSLNSWRSEMKAKLPKPSWGGLGSPLSYGFASRPLGEKRSSEEFVAELDLYVQTVKSDPNIWLSIMASEWLKQDRSKLGVSIVNNSDENYENTVVELTIALGRASLHFDAREAPRVLGVPEEPEEWGERFPPSLLRSNPIIRPVGEPQPEIEKLAAGATLVRYPEFRVRPHTKHPLKPILRHCRPALRGVRSRCAGARQPATLKASRRESWSYRFPASRRSSKQATMPQYRSRTRKLRPRKELAEELAGGVPRSDGLGHLLIPECRTLPEVRPVLPNDGPVR